MPWRYTVTLHCVRTSHIHFSRSRYIGITCAADLYQSSRNEQLSGPAVGPSGKASETIGFNTEGNTCNGMIALGMNKDAKLYSQTRGRQSLLFDQQKAADVDLATIYAIGCQGLCASAWSFSVLVCTQMIDRRRLQVWMHYVVLMLDSPLTEKVYSLKLPQASVETSRLKKPLPKSTRPSRLSSAPFRTTSWLLALSRPWSISFAGIGEGSQTLIMILTAVYRYPCMHVRSAPYPC